MSLSDKWLGVSGPSVYNATDMVGKNTVAHFKREAEHWWQQKQYRRVVLEIERHVAKAIGGFGGDPVAMNQYVNRKYGSSLVRSNYQVVRSDYDFTGKVEATVAMAGRDKWTVHWVVHLSRLSLSQARECEWEHIPKQLIANMPVDELKKIVAHITLEMAANGFKREDDLFSDEYKQWAGDPTIYTGLATRLKYGRARSCKWHGNK